MAVLGLLTAERDRQAPAPGLFLLRELLLRPWTAEPWGQTTALSRLELLKAGLLSRALIKGAAGLSGGRSGLLTLPGEALQGGKHSTNTGSPPQELGHIVTLSW